ncbi:MAG: class I SAM-dependent methyltransferase, partial [Chloroflexi bacterium]|nr:class I SAM-dependent methyltransferase [Chloroflexota bacterium]
MSGETWGTAYAAATADAMTVYDEIMVPRIFGPWADLLLDTVGIAQGDRVLDVATGPGTVARRAAARTGASGRVTGCDLSPAMLEVATSKPPDAGAAAIGYVHCPADALDVPDGAFDVALCQQGLQFFPDRPAALAEMRRALRPGGRLGLAVWCTIEECPPFAALADACEPVLGAEVTSTYRQGPWGLPDPDELRRLVVAAGFSGVEVTRRTLPVVVEGGPSQMLATTGCAVLAPLIAAL